MKNITHIFLLLLLLCLCGCTTPGGEPVSDDPPMPDEAEHPPVADEEEPIPEIRFLVIDGVEYFHSRVHSEYEMAKEPDNYQMQEILVRYMLAQAAGDFDAMLSYVAEPLTGIINDIRSGKEDIRFQAYILSDPDMRILDIYDVLAMDETGQYFAYTFFEMTGDEKNWQYQAYFIAQDDTYKIVYSQIEP